MLQDGVCDSLARAIHQVFRINPVVKGGPLDRLHFVGIEDCVSHRSLILGSCGQSGTDHAATPDRSTGASAAGSRVRNQYFLSASTCNSILTSSPTTCVPSMALFQAKTEVAALESGCRIPAGENGFLHACPFADQLDFQKRLPW